MNLALLSEPAERDLIKKLGAYPSQVAEAAQALEPHRVVAYLEELARLVHAWYHHHRVLDLQDEDPDLGIGKSKARLVLAAAAQTVLRDGLHLLGVSAPDRM